MWTRTGGGKARPKSEQACPNNGRRTPGATVDCYVYELTLCHQDLSASGLRAGGVRPSCKDGRPLHPDTRCVSRADGCGRVLERGGRSAPAQTRPNSRPGSHQPPWGGPSTRRPQGPRYFCARHATSGGARAATGRSLRRCWTPWISEVRKITALGEHPDRPHSALLLYAFSFAPDQTCASCLAPRVPIGC